MHCSRRRCILWLLSLDYLNGVRLRELREQRPLSLKERDFVLASKHLGAGNAQNHVPAYCAEHELVHHCGWKSCSGKSDSDRIHVEFMGLGVQLPKASWGTMLQGAQVYIMDTPWLAVFPGIFIVGYGDEF